MGIHDNRSAVTPAEAAQILLNSSYRNIVFDVDDTLYLRSDPYIRAYRSCFNERRGLPDGADMYRVSRVYVEEEYKRRIRGEINMREMLIRRTLRSFAAFGIELTPEEALHFEETYEREQGCINLLPIWKTLLDDLCSSGRKPFLGILTNGPSAHQWNKIKALGVTRWIPESHIAVSGDTGVSKPEPAAFHKYEEICGIKPEETVMVGDNLEADILGAEAALWHALWVQA